MITGNPETIGELIEELGLEPAPRGKNRGKYECPACGEQKLSINRDGKQYNCYGCGDNSAVLSELYKMWWAEQRRKGYSPPPRQYQTLIKTEDKPDAIWQTDWDEASEKLRTLGLPPLAKEELDRRGYSTEAIRLMGQSGWFGVPAGRTEVTHLGLPEKFPGTQWWQDEDGFKRQYLNSPRIQMESGDWVDWEAIAIPRYRWDGTVTGYQLRLLGEVQKDQRYRYFRSKGSANGNQVRLHNFDGTQVKEGAITICDSRRLFKRGELTVDALNFVEANLKPHICAYKHTGIWIGTNSNSFASSPVQLQEIGNSARSQNIKILRFHLDARTLPCQEKPDGNPSILVNWAKLAQYFYKNYPEFNFNIEVYAYGNVDPDEIDAIRPEHYLGEFNAVFAAALEKSHKLRKAAKALLKGDRGCEWIKEIRRIQRWLHRRVLQFHNKRELQRIKAERTTAIVLRSQFQEWGETSLHAWPIENPPYLRYDPNNIDSINYTRHKHSKTGVMPTIILDSLDHYEAFHRDAISMGCRHLLNCTEAGGGKSHNTALLEPEAIGIESQTIKFTDENRNVQEKEIHPRLFYFVDSPRNPTNQALEERSICLPARAEELYENPRKKTPCGNSYIHSSDINGIYIPIPNSGNCGYSSLHTYLNTLGYSPEVRHRAICQRCPAMTDNDKALNCSHYSSSMTVRDSQTGEELEFPFGFLAERVDVLSEETFIRLHHSQAPGKTDINADSGQRSGISDITDMVVHDDCVPQTQKTYYVTAATCDRTARILKYNHEAAVHSEKPEDIAKTATQLEAFDKLLTTLGHYIENAELGKYGLGDPQVREAMAEGRASDDPSLWVEAYNKLTNITGQTVWTSKHWKSEKGYINPCDHSYETILMSLRNSCRGLGSNLGKIEQTLEENKGKSSEECLNALRKTAIPQFLRPLILAGLGHGSFRIESEFNPSTQRWENKLAITVKDRSQVKNSRGCFNIHLDATMTRAEYAQIYGVKESQVWVMRHQPMSHDNLTIFQYQDMGKLASGKWSEEIIDRLTAAVTEAHQSHCQWAIDCDLDPEGIGIIAPKWLISTGVFDQIVPRERQGWWFAHTRGTNIWQNCHTLYCVGSPRSSLGHLAVSWQVRTGESIDLSNKGDHPGFWKWANSLIRKEQIQTAARLRSGRSGEPKNIHWFCSESLKPLEKAFPGCKIKTNKSKTLSPKAAPRVDRHLHAMGDAIVSCLENGIKPTQKVIASMIDWSEARISENCKELIQVLINSGEAKMTGRQYFRPFLQTFTLLYKSLIGKRKFSSDSGITDAMRQFAEMVLPKQLRSYLDEREKIAAQVDQDIGTDDAHEQFFGNAWRILSGMLRCGASDSTVVEKIVSLLDGENRAILAQVLMDVFPLNPALDVLEHTIDSIPALAPKRPPPMVEDSG